MFKRYAIIYTPLVKVVENYLPSNYAVIFSGVFEGREVTVIEGQDNAGWTLDGYVLPRLASGLYFGQEIDLSHPIMKEVPDDRH